MVLYKRKPVPFPPPKPLPEDLNVKCWYIPYTKEWFLNYDDYLQRLDYYNTRKFVCEITGNSCLTFFEAYESEQKEMKIVEKNFPEHLKEPILRHLQFSTVPRIDQLVDDVYTTFKNDYYPGETVMIRLNDYKNDFKTRCIIREKAKFNAVVDANNNHRPAYCQYRVSRVDNGLEVVVDESQITRDRNNFTKWFVKTFIKLSVSRSPKIGAPWIVKSKYASKFRIPTELPPELAQFKEKPPTPKRKPPQNIRPKGEKGEGSAKNGGEGGKKLAPLAPGSKLRNIAPAPAGKGGRQANIKAKEATPPPKRTIEEDLSQPIESLAKRPKPQKLTIIDDVIQEALESWTFLNVYRTPLLLDTFTFDDFITALKWDNKSKQCVLLNEIFCAVLSAFINEQSTDLQITIPEDYDPEDFDIEEEEDNVKEEKTNEDDGVKDESQQNGDASHIKSENGESKEKKDVKEEDKDSDKKEDEEDDDEEEEEAVEEEHHELEKYLEYRGVSWQERLQKRNFKDGNWQIILLGVLDLARDIKDYQPTIQKTFEILAPLGSTISPNAILSNFIFNLSINLRIKILNILCSLLVNSPIIRQFLDKCMSDSTELRRERLELLREYKGAFEKAQNTDKELRELVGAANNNANFTATGTPSAKDTNGEAKDSQPSESNEPNLKKRRRRTGISKEPTEQELAIAKTNPQYATLLASRTAQLKISEDLRTQRKNLEKKIVELDVQRIRYLGKDRLFNRYWWFENNGLPNLGGSKSSGGGDEENNEAEQDEEDDDEDDEDDEFLSETYLMGRLWVQGPTDEDALLKFGFTKEKIQEWNELFNPKKEDEDEEDGEEDDDENDEDNEENDKEGKKKKNGGSKKTSETKEETKDQDETQDEITDEPSSSLSPNFVESAEKLFQLKFEATDKNIKSTKDDRTLVDEYGAIARNLQPVERKIIEENPDPLLTTRHWRYYDTVDDVEKLIGWLNPWGDREVKLLKELNFVKDQIVSSVKSRRKALKLDTKSQDEEQLLKTIEEIIISETEEESSSESESEEEGETGSEADPEFLGLGEEEEQPRTRRSIAAAEKQAEERRRKEAEIRKRIEERQAKKERSKPSRRIARREAKKRKLKEHEEKKRNKAELESKLENLQESNEIQRCLDWVNQSAIESLGHTHYEGPIKTVPGRSKRSRR